MISFRYNVIGSQPTNEQERVYNTLAEKIASRLSIDPGAMLKTMASVYPGNDAFRAAFAEKSMRTTQSRNKHVVFYILDALELRLTGTALVLTAIVPISNTSCGKTPRLGCGEKRRRCVGKTKHGKGCTVSAIADSNGLPVAVSTTSGNPIEAKLGPHGMAERFVADAPERLIGSKA